MKKPTMSFVEISLALIFIGLTSFAAQSQFNQEKLEYSDWGMGAIATSTDVVIPPQVSDENATTEVAMPDPVYTPGAINPDITQNNIFKNICNPDWSTKSIRPPVSYTNSLKAKQITEYAYNDIHLQDYEEDHLISLELGGSPTDPKNLWPEPYAVPGAKQKDAVENYLHKEVCSGSITLSDAQAEIVTNWYLVYLQMPAINTSKLGSATNDSDPDDN